MRRILKRVRQEDMIPLLETERLRFRAWNAGDFEPFAAIYADEAHARYIGGACERDEAWRRLAGVIGHWTLRGYGLWALEAKRDGSFVGRLSLRRTAKGSRRKRRCERARTLMTIWDGRRRSASSPSRIKPPSRSPNAWARGWSGHDVSRDRNRNFPPSR